MITEIQHDFSAWEKAMENRQTQRTGRWLLPGSLLSVALSIVIAMGAAWPASTASKQVTPQRYIREVCNSLVTWIDATSPIDAQIVARIDALREKKLSAAKTKTKVVALYVKATKATDKLIVATKAAGSPQLANGAQLAKDHLQGLVDLRNAYKEAAKAAAKLKTKNATTMYVLLEAVDAALTTRFDSIGMPLESLQTDATLTQLINADSRCNEVIDSYKASFEPTGFKVGDCVSLNDYTVVNCSDPHDIEVYVTTTYPAGADAAFPGNTVVNEYADHACEAAFAAYVGVPLGQSKYSYTSLYPSSETWAAGDREVVCGVSNQTDTPLTGPVRGSSA